MKSSSGDAGMPQSGGQAAGRPEHCPAPNRSLCDVGKAGDCLFMRGQPVGSCDALLYYCVTGEP